LITENTPCFSEFEYFQTVAFQICRPLVMTSCRTNAHIVFPAASFQLINGRMQVTWDYNICEKVRSLYMSIPLKLFAFDYIPTSRHKPPQPRLAFGAALPEMRGVPASAWLTSGCPLEQRLPIPFLQLGFER
jgi:hypothetical protein